jgi:hypothetical protein
MLLTLKLNSATIHTFSTISHLVHMQLQPANIILKTLLSTLYYSTLYCYIKGLISTS